MDKVLIKSRIITQLCEAAEEATEEIIYALFGKDSYITAVRAVQNISTTPKTVYTPNRLEYIKCILEPPSGLQLLGWFHNHLASEAWYSPTDIKFGRKHGIYAIYSNLTKNFNTFYNNGNSWNFIPYEQTF